MGSLWPWILGIGTIIQIAAQIIGNKKKKSKYVAKIAELEKQLSKLSREREAERKGRIRVQQELRAKIMSPNPEAPAGAFPMTPIGILRTCFSTRNGTPRQPLLVPLSRAKLELKGEGGVPPSSLEGLEGYSHCWLIYLFSLNTDLGGRGRGREMRGKVRVPRLNGGRVGVLATRTPHRPCPIGLSVAKVERVEGRTVFLSGVDIVDGTPVFDLKPYLPYSDSVENASVPFWTETENPNDPLNIKAVQFCPNFEESLQNCWENMSSHSLYPSPLSMRDLLEQVLSRDIRSVCQRNRPHTGRQVVLSDSPKNKNSSKSKNKVSDSEGSFSSVSRSEAESVFSKNNCFEGNNSFNDNNNGLDGSVSLNNDNGLGGYDGLNSSGLNDNKGLKNGNNLNENKCLIENDSFTANKGGGDVMGGLEKAKIEISEIEGEDRDEEDNDECLVEVDNYESTPSENVEYHVVLEGIDFVYTIDSKTVFVKFAQLSKSHKTTKG